MNTIAREHIEYHKDGSVRAKGQSLEGEFARLLGMVPQDGPRLPSGHFERGVQVSEWTTYDQRGEVYKVTRMKGSVPARRTSRMQAH